jgi:hypothetical protein
LGAQVNHVQRAGARFFNVAGQEQGLGNARAAGDGCVRAAQVVHGELRRQFAGVPDFEPVGKQHDLNGGVGGVVAVGHSVDDGFGHGFAGQLIAHRGLRPCGSCAHGAGYFGQAEVQRLIDQLKHRAFVDLVRGDGLADLRAVEVHALEFRAGQKTLWGLAKEQNCRMAGLPGIQQVQVR